MKVPPKTIFWGQFWASLWSCFVQVGVLLWAFANITGICTEDQKNNFTCPGGRVFFNASIIWGVIGPARVSRSIRKRIVDLLTSKIDVQQGFNLWSSSIFLACRWYSSSSNLGCGKEMASKWSPVFECPHHLWWSRHDSTVRPSIIKLYSP
jgi:OPT oligopeptide transporter protein